MGLVGKYTAVGGLSPPTRGIQRVARRVWGAEGSIPAYAGDPGINGADSPKY